MITTAPSVSLELNIGSSDFSTRAESLTWKGKLHYGAEKDSPAKIETDGLLAAQKFNFAVPASELVLEESRIDSEWQDHA